MNKKIGYIYATESEVSEWIRSMQDNGLDKGNIYYDTYNSENNLDKLPAYESMKCSIKDGDILYIKNINMLGHSCEEITSEWMELIDKKNIDIITTDTPVIDTTDPENKDVILNIIPALINSIGAIKSSFKEKGKSLNVKRGRPKQSVPASFEEEIAKWRSGKQSAMQTRKNLNLAKTTFYRELKARGL